MVIVRILLKNRTALLAMILSYHFSVSSKETLHSCPRAQTNTWRFYLYSFDKRRVFEGDFNFPAWSFTRKFGYWFCHWHIWVWLLLFQDFHANNSAENDHFSPWCLFMFWFKLSAFIKQQRRRFTFIDLPAASLLEHWLCFVSFMDKNFCLNPVFHASIT